MCPSCALERRVGKASEGRGQRSWPAGPEPSLHRKKFACIAPRLPGSTMATWRKRQSQRRKSRPLALAPPGKKRGARKNAKTGAAGAGAAARGGGTGVRGDRARGDRARGRSSRSALPGGAGASRTARDHEFDAAGPVEHDLARADALQRYMAEVARHPLLTREEEHDLAARYVQTRDPHARLPAGHCQPAAGGQNRARVPPRRVQPPRPRFRKATSGSCRR